MMKKSIHYLFVFLVIVSLKSLSLFGQISSNEIDILVEKSMKEFNVAGVAVAVVKDGKIIHKKGYGVKSIETKLPVDVHTNFQIASNTKAFTTAALAILIDEGKLSWKDKVKKYIPEFKMYNEYVTENFIIEDLLCHRSGLGLGVGDLMRYPDGADFTIKDVLNSFQYFKPASDFRTKYDYDNSLYLVAGEVIARISGMTWEKFIQTRIMEPLQMNNSYSSQIGKYKQNLATPHSTEFGAIQTINLYQDRINGAPGGILSNIDDMSKWIIMQLNHGKYGEKLDKELFTVARQKEMWKIHIVMDANPNPRYNSHFAGYGLGWNLTDMNGQFTVSHTGGRPGMLSKVSLIPDMKLGVVILTNTANGGGALFNAVNNSIIDSYLGLSKVDYIDWFSGIIKGRKSNSDTITRNVWKQVELVKNTPINVQDYMGTYEDNWFGKIEIFMNGNQLWFKSLRSPKLNGPMRLYKANTFAIRWEYQDMPCDAFAIFGLDQEGKDQSIKMKGISPDIDFSFDFQDLDFQRVKE